jgi:glycosyltransferase involved in cell wall biosynthesis
MMRIAMIARSTLFSSRGGDTVQVMQTAKYLREAGVMVDVKLTTEHIDYGQYTLLHFFNIIRPADILYHISRTKKPFVISTIFVDYSEYEKYHRKGLPGMMFRYLPADTIEYVKAIARKAVGSDSLRNLSYVWNGQRRSIHKILGKASLLLPNSDSEYKRLQTHYQTAAAHAVITNGIDGGVFFDGDNHGKDELLVLCVARIEGIKNQLNLIKALSGTKFRLLLIGSPAPNQASYFNECIKAAGGNVSFIGHVKQDELRRYYQLAKVHVLPSWFETTGLSSLEAAVMGCNIVITEKGDAKEYFGNLAFYCDPSSPESIYEAIEKAAQSKTDPALQQKIKTQHTWQQAAEQTKNAYQKVLAQL